MLAQRLARRICNSCKTPYHPDRKEYDRLVEVYGEAFFAKHINIPYSQDFTLMIIQGSTDLKEVLKICRYEKRDEGPIVDP